MSTYSFDRLNLILESTTEGWWEWNIAENTSYHSPQWYKMLGYKEEDWKSTFNVWKEFMHPDDKEQTIRLQDLYMRTKEHWQLEFRMRTSDGGYKWIQSRGRIIERDVNHQPAIIAGIHLDITEQKHNEQLKEEYRKQEELLKGIIKVSPAAFKTYDFIQKKMIYSSHLGAKFLNYSPEEYERLSQDVIKELIHPDDVVHVEEALHKLIHTPGNDTVECFFRLKKSDGQYIWAKTTDWVSKRSEDGTVVEIIGSIQDVTRFRALDEKIEQSIKILENVSYKNSHQVRAQVASILGLTELIKLDLPHSGIDPLLITHLERTVIKLDEVIRDFNNSLSGQLGDLS